MLPGIVQCGQLSRAKAIGEVLKNSDADVIVFQEAFHPGARKIIRTLLEEQFPYEAGPANKSAWSLKASSGIWILSRHPIIAQQTIAYQMRTGVDALARKGALLVELSVNDHVVQVIGTHLQNSGPAWIRQLQCAELYHRLLKPSLKSGVPQVVCGDFNIRQSSEEYAQMLETLHSQDGSLSGAARFTFHRGENDLHSEPGNSADLIDYILLANHNGHLVQERQIKMLRKKWCASHVDLSDHYALQAEIRWPEEMVVASH